MTDWVWVVEVRDREAFSDDEPVLVFREEANARAKFAEYESEFAGSNHDVLLMRCEIEETIEGDG